MTAEAWLEHLETVFEKSDATSDLYERDLIMDVRLNEVPNGIVGMPMTEMEAAESISNRSRDDTAKVRRVCIISY